MYDFEQITREMTELPSSADLDILVNEILEKTLLIVQADAGLLWEYDAESKLLFCKAYKGIARDIALSLRLKLGEGLIGKTYLRGTPKLYYGIDEIRRDIDDFSAENKDAMQKLFGSNEINSAYLMPIYVHQQIECILIVYRALENSPFSSTDIETLNIFSGLIEIALSNARGLIALQTQIDRLRKCNNLYARLTNYSVNNSGITSIVDELSSALDVPVIVINLMTNERYPKNAQVSTAILSELKRRSAKDDDSYRIESEGDGESYRIYPIVAENSCLGYLLAPAEGSEHPLNRMLLEVGRMVLAVEFSKAQSRLDISYKRMAQSFSELLSANSSAGLAEKCSEFGIHIKASYAVLIFAFQLSESIELQESTVYRVISYTRKELGSFQKLIFGSRERIVVLLPVQSEDWFATASRQINRVLSSMMQKEGLVLFAGMGSPGNGAGEISKSYHEAEKAVLYQLSQQKSGLLQYSQMGVNQVFANLSSDDAASFLSSVLAPLSEKSESLEETLFSYIELNYSLKKTAQKLYIHPNTLYQRLKKIENILNISFNNPEDLLKLQLARYLKNYYPDAKETNSEKS
ncbi:MAG: helix-turn-helix domain-containing protein [Clostridiaceae bacterium]